MIGFDATNSLGQGLAAREKIFSFTLAYFTFINDAIPALSFQIASENKQNIIGFVSQKTLEYFKNFIINTEGEKDANGNLISDNESPLAKYYLAAIYYYEPYFDFTSASIPDIYKLGETYLLEMFSENISLLLEKSRNFANFRIPNFPESTEKDFWKFFTYALITATYSKQYVNIVQQPVSLSSRSGNYLFDFIKEPNEKNLAKFTDNKFYTTHENKNIVGKLKDINPEKLPFDLGDFYNSVKFYVKDNWLNYYKTVIDVFDLNSGFKKWWDLIGVGLDNQLGVFLNEIDPKNKKSPEEQKKALENLLIIIDKCLAIAPKKVDAKDGIVLVKPIEPTNLKIPTKDTYPSSGLNFITPETFTNYTYFYDGDDVLLQNLLFHYRQTIVSYAIMAEKKVADFWEDAPNTIKSYVKSIKNYVNTNSPLPNDWQNYSHEFFVTYFLNDGEIVFPLEITFEDYINLYFKTYPSAKKATLDSNGNVDKNSTAYKKIKENLLKEFNNKIQTPNEISLDKAEISVFFEFSFQPNLQRIKEKFLNKITDENLKSLENLKNNYFLNFSKTETYTFLVSTVGQNETESLTIQEFSSLFDLCVALQHKLSQKYIKNINKEYLKKSIKDLTNAFVPFFSFRRWADTKSINGLAYKRNLVLYNPLSIQELNNLESLSLQDNASINLGSASEYNINNIAVFNPTFTFLDDELVYKFISKIENTPMGEFLKENYNFMPYDFSEVGKNLMINKVSSLPENFILNNNALFVNSHSELSKNLINNLITSIQEMKEE